MYIFLNLIPLKSYIRINIILIAIINIILKKQKKINKKY